MPRHGRDVPSRVHMVGAVSASAAWAAWWVDCDNCCTCPKTRIRRLAHQNFGPCGGTFSRSSGWIYPLFFVPAPAGGTVVTAGAWWGWMDSCPAAIGLSRNVCATRIAIQEKNLQQCPNDCDCELLGWYIESGVVGIPDLRNDFNDVLDYSLSMLRGVHPKGNLQYLHKVSGPFWHYLGISQGTPQLDP